MKNYLRNFFDVLMFFTLLTVVLISFDVIDGVYITFFYVGMIVCPVYWFIEYIFEKKTINNYEKKREDISILDRYFV